MLFLWNLPGDMTSLWAAICKNVLFVVVVVVVVVVTVVVVVIEQSAPNLPGSHEHSPVDVSQFPALLQSAGQESSVK